MHTIPAAWYDDPAGSGGQRWWDGAAWSQHVRPAEAPVMQPAYTGAQTHSYQSVAADPFAQSAQVSAPAAATEPYRPFGGYVPVAPAARVSDAYWVAPVEKNNGAAWISLIAGVIGLAIVVISFMSGVVVMVYFFPLIVALGSGIRALSQRASGTASALVVPILGILCVVVAVSIYLLVLFTNWAAGDVGGFGY